MSRPWAIALRVVGGLLLAAGVVWGLSAFVVERDRTAQAAVRDAAAVDDVRIAVPQGLRGRAERVVLMAAVPSGPAEDGIAPMVEILATGDIAVRRPAPRPDGPVAAPWPRAGIVLPTPSLSALTAPQRAALLELWSAFSDGEGVTAETLATQGVALDGPLERLLRWQR